MKLALNMWCWIGLCWNYKEQGKVEGASHMNFDEITKFLKSLDCIGES